MIPIGLIANLGMMGAGGLMGLLGKRGPDFSGINNYMNQFSGLFNQFQGELPFYTNALQETITGLGSSREKERQQAIMMGTSPIAQAVRSAQTSMQNQQAKSGVLLPGTVQASSAANLQQNAAAQQALAIREIEQRFSQEEIQRQGMRGQLAAAQASQLRGLVSNITSQQLQGEFQKAGMREASKQQGFNAQSAGGAMFGAGLGGISGMLDKFLGGGATAAGGGSATGGNLSGLLGGLMGAIPGMGGIGAGVGGGYDIISQLMQYLSQQNQQ